MGIAYIGMKMSDYGGVFFDFMSAKYGWYEVQSGSARTRDQKNLTLAMISLIGQMIGATVASFLMRYLGRKQLIVYSLLAANAFCIPCLILNYYLFLGMRTGLALSLGIFYATASRYIEEYLPLKKHGVSWASIQTMSQSGILETICLSFLFP